MEGTRVPTPEALVSFARRVARALKQGSGRATVLALSGELGAGKTAFTKALAASLGVREEVTSPTFVIVRTYPLMRDFVNRSFERLVHIDAYRLKSAEELSLLGWRELADDPGNLIVVEWPERVASLIPEEAVRIRFDIEGEERIITVDGVEEEKSGA